MQDNQNPVTPSAKPPQDSLSSPPPGEGSSAKGENSRSAEGAGAHTQSSQRRRRRPRHKTRIDPRQHTRRIVDRNVSSVEQSQQPAQGVQHPRNPPWTCDELILALDVYLRYNPSKISKHHPEILNLSRALRKLPLHRHRGDRKSFRSPASVYMQLRTFMSLDPRSRAAGLTHVNKLEQQIWRDYSRDLTTLNKLAVALRSLSNSPLAQQLNGSVVEEDDCPAGKLLFRLHKRLESNDKLNDMKKERARVLHCELCGFDFEKTYGSVGKGYVEIHNRLPLTHMRANRRTHLSDLILVCSNCHRMLHRQRPHSNLRITRDADKRESTKDANSREQK